jgi:cyclophilin family peptidyl-prolyl cis-trans isomerase
MQSTIRMGFLLVVCVTFSLSLFGQQEKRRLVEIRTEMGTMVVALYNETPIHRDNFLKLVGERAYDGLLFHRVIRGFMVQGGDPDSRNAKPGAALGMGDPGYTLPAEIVPGLVHKRGALAAARLGDRVNPERRSNGMQFYIVEGRTYQPADLDRMVERASHSGDTLVYTQQNKDIYARDGGTPQLDGAYTVFGEVILGEEVIDHIAAVRTDPQDRPLMDIIMTMRIVE